MSHYYYCDHCGYVHLEISRKRLKRCIRCMSTNVTERFVPKKDLSEFEIAVAEMIQEKLKK